MSCKRYVVVGTGARSAMYIEALAGTYRQTAQLVGLCDSSRTRMDYYNRQIQEKFSHPPVPSYLADQFEKMVREQKPDAVIVCTSDFMHHHYIVRAMELGCDAISEKPMTVDAAKARDIFHAIEKTGRKLRVTFNYRYAPHVTKLRELIMQGVIGKPMAVDFSWVMDTSHGADYFRRWHREKDKSGGLLVHKATHHFDLVNWWIDSRPQTVFAMGDLKFYGQAAAQARGEHYDYDRYTGHDQAKNDPFALVLNNPNIDDPAKKSLYYDAEKETGYVRDRNVFGRNVTIEDTMAVMVRYRNNVVMNYSLIAYSPWEGFRVAITGDKGRVELYDKHGGHVILGQDGQQLGQAQAVEPEQLLKVFPMFGQPYPVEIPKGEGPHGGGDVVMLQQVFDENPPADPFNRGASHIDGATSCLVGFAANESIRTGLPVNCRELLPISE